MQQQESTRAPLSVFISYAHEDEPLCRQLEAHLSLQRRQGLISEWHDREILPGAEWSREIDQHLEAASLILLLISPDFLASDYCYEIEMQRALERHKQGEVCVIPIILRPCDWRTSPFARLQCLPRDGKAVTTWQNPDEAFLAIVQGLRRMIEEQQIPTRLLFKGERRNRTRLMKRVRAIWIEGVLEHSLHKAALIALHLQEQSDALANPWQLEVQETNRPPRPFPAGTSIVQVHDEADGELLILGEPGAGKTTLLLELARTLLDRAEADERACLPVVFNLSSWARKRPLLSTWLVEELGTKYQIPRKIGQSWVAATQILPLLDGLDEMGEDVRSACVRAINIYHQDCAEKGQAPLVVCCRHEEYMALPTRVNLHQAVSIRPLTSEQIERYLQSAGDQLDVLQQTLHHDPELYELAHRPFMLSIFTLAYQGARPEEMPTEGTREAQQRQVFATYVERMLSHRGISKHASREQMLRWSMFLATQMQLHQQTIFFLEHLQPDWLGKRHRRLLYRLSVGPFVGLVSGLVFGLAFDLTFGLLFGLGLVFGLSAGSLTGLLVGLLVELVFRFDQIQPREILTLFWREAKRAIVYGLVYGLVVGLLAGQISGLVFTRLLTNLAIGVVCGLVFGFGLFVGLASRFSTNQLDDRQRLIPNQGIWRSAQNGLLVGLLIALAFGLLIIPILRLLGFPSLFYGLGVLCVVLYGVVAALVAGLGAFFQHFALRFWLWCTRRLPWNVVVFLNEAAKRLLLRKVGGGYIFVHRLLLDYFASLEKKEP